jgi:hypothetical protein
VRARLGWRGLLGVSLAVAVVGGTLVLQWQPGPGGEAARGLIRRGPLAQPGQTGARLVPALGRAGAAGREGGAPAEDADGRLSVPLADPPPPRLPADGVPAGWHLQPFAGQPVVELIRTEIGLTLRLRSAQSSFALYRGIVVDLEAFPVLGWAWKVLRQPAGGDGRRRDADDQAVQVYVVFPRWPAPRASSDVIGYVWDTPVPVGTGLTSPKAPTVRVIVVDSGSEGLGTWRYHQRDIRADYVALFGREPPRVGSVALMIDSDDTGSAAEALVGALAFSPS